MDRLKTDRIVSAMPFGRREMLGQTAGALAAGAAGLSVVSCASPSAAPAGVAADAAPDARRGRLKQSIAQWCFAKTWNLDALCGVAKQLGCGSVELVDPKDWPTLKRHGLVCAIAFSHGFEKGFNDPANHAMCVAKIREAVDACAAAGFPNVITFTGFRENIPDDAGQKNCVAGLKKVIGYAEEKKVNLCLEMLNSRVAEEMKGHPGYQGDHMDYCVEIVRQIGSPRMKLLFDVYHVQVMDGDVIVRIRQYADLIGHVHTAGVPGRREMDDRQEINYRPVMKALADAKYAGFVGHEFVPTRDPLEGLKEAVAVCTV